MAKPEDIETVPSYVLRDYWVEGKLSSEDYTTELMRRQRVENAKDARTKLLEAALLRIGKEIVEAPKDVITDTFWMTGGSPFGETVVDFITNVVADERHPDDKAVDEFVHAMGEAMKAKLAKKRDEGFTQWWDKYNFPWEVLIKNFLKHIQKGDPIDVANYCMFLYHRGERTDGGQLSDAKPDQS